MEGHGQLRAGGGGRRRGHAHGRAHAAHRRPALGREDHGHRRAAWASACWPRATRPRAASSTARPTRSSASARTSTSRAASTASAAAATWAAILTDTEFGGGPQPRGGRGRLAALGPAVGERDLPGHADASRPTARESQGRPRAARPTTRSRPSASSSSPRCEHYDRGFQMDTAFLNQVGITQGWTYVAPELLPGRQEVPLVQALRALRLRPVRAATASRAASPGSWCPAFRMHFTRQGFLRIDTIFGRGAVAQAGRSASATRASSGEAQITRWLYFFAAARLRPLDLLRRRRSLPRPPAAPTTPRSPCSRARASTRRSSYNRVEFDRLTTARASTP